MAIMDTFSKRKRLLGRVGAQDVYKYDALPTPFRIQVVHIWKSAIGEYYASDFSDESPANQFWKLIHDSLSREHGVFTLHESFSDARTKCQSYLLGADVDGALDIIELSFRVIDDLVRKLPAYLCVRAAISQTPDDAIEELNHRFQEHQIGYQYSSGILLRLDSQFAHAEIVKPALSLLSGTGFDGPADEFINAFEHYRHGRYKETVAETLKAFESTMKAICAARQCLSPNRYRETTYRHPAQEWAAYRTTLNRISRDSGPLSNRDYLL